MQHIFEESVRDRMGDGELFASRTSIKAISVGKKKIKELRSFLN